MKAQLGVEFLVILFVISIMSIVIFNLNSENIDLSHEFNLKENSENWKMREIGIKTISFNDSGIYIYLTNNLREQINIVEIYFDDVDLNISNITTYNILPGETGIFNSSLDYYNKNFKIKIEYMIQEDFRVFDGSNMTFIRN